MKAGDSRVFQIFTGNLGPRGRRNVLVDTHWIGKRLWSILLVQDQKTMKHFTCLRPPHNNANWVMDVHNAGTYAYGQSWALAVIFIFLQWKIAIFAYSIDLEYVILMGLPQRLMIFIVRMAWKQLFELHLWTANRKCPALAYALSTRCKHGGGGDEERKGQYSPGLNSFPIPQLFGKAHACAPIYLRCYRTICYNNHLYVRYVYTVRNTLSPRQRDVRKL